MKPVGRFSRETLPAKRGEAFLGQKPQRHHRRSKPGRLQGLGALKHAGGAHGSQSHVGADLGFQSNQSGGNTVNFQGKSCPYCKQGTADGIGTAPEQTPGKVRAPGRPPRSIISGIIQNCPAIFSVSGHRARREEHFSPYQKPSTAGLARSRSRSSADYFFLIILVIKYFYR